MKLSNLFFFGILAVLLLSCEDGRYMPVVELENDGLTYQEFRGIMEMTNDSTIRLGGSNSAEYEADIDIHVIGNKVVFLSVEFDFDLDESNIYGVDACQIYGAHCSLDKSNVKLLVFEPEENFWECMSRENCDPGDEVFQYEVFVRKPV